jgi:hypothetical protein
MKTLKILLLYLLGIALVFALIQGFVEGACAETERREAEGRYYADLIRQGTEGKQ